MPSLTPCCGTSIGVLIYDQAGRLLMITRGWYPTGVAPVAGHVRDAHADAASALVEEVREETGLHVTSHRMLVTGMWLPNLCQSVPAIIPGHRWDLGEATATGELTPDPVETRGAQFYDVDEQRTLAHRTLALAYGQISDQEFEDAPGMEPVWLELLHIARRLPVTLTPHDLTLVQRLYTTPPAAYWDDSRGVEVPAEQVARDHVPT